MGSLCNNWVGVGNDILLTYGPDDLQNVHELLGGVGINNLSLTLVRVHVESTGTGINYNTGQILVVVIVNSVVAAVVLGSHGGLSCTLLLYQTQGPGSRGRVPVLLPVHDVTIG